MRRRHRGRALVVLPFLLAVLAACTDPVRQDLDETRAKLDALQGLVSSINRDLSSLQTIVSELDDSHSVHAVSPVEGVGYDLSFKDGKVVRITFGKDGTDGRVLPLGVLQDENGVYCWTVDGEFLLDEAGNKVQAGATQGVDGVVPQLKTEEGSWWISLDGGASFEPLATCEEMDGYTVFKSVDAVSDPEKVLLTLSDGTVMELPRYVPVYLSFGEPQLRRMIAPGERLPVEYLLKGSAAANAVVTAGTDGTYISEMGPSAVNADSTERRGLGFVKAPKEFAEGYILLNAFSNGYSTVQVVSFTQRTIELPEGNDFSLTSRGGDLKVPYKAEGFDLYITLDEAARSWLWAGLDDNGNILISAPSYYGETAREGQVFIQPLDNPMFNLATLTVRQTSPFEE